MWEIYNTGKLIHKEENFNLKIYIYNIFIKINNLKRNETKI